MTPDAIESPFAWPATLAEGPVKLRPIRRSDQRAWTAVREANRQWLEPWDATSPDPAGQPAGFATYVRQVLSCAREGNCFPWVIEFESRLIGQLGISGITHGAVQSGTIGYWLSERFAGHGIMPTAVALAFDHAIGVARLHRLEIAIRPENHPSLRVVEKLGFRPEGLRRNFLHVAGQWRDHLIFALTREEVPEGLLARCRSAGLLHP
jgi:ribosomal-protein-alanine N-acetyltransferase